MVTDRVGQLLESRPEHDAVPMLKTAPQVAPALQSKALSLERAIAIDAVGHLLESRPDAKALQSSGVLSLGTAAGLQAVQRDLERQITKDHIGHLLESRPNKQDLVTIVPQETIAPALQATAKKLSFRLTKDNLERSLSARPEAWQVVERGILNLDVVNAGGRDDDVDYDDDDDEEDSPEVARIRMSIALKAASRLYKTNALDQTSRALLKDLVLAGDARVMAAVRVFELDHDLEELLDTLMRVVLVAG